ncbi:hypothetical protein CEUSTIGMA_g2083.t1 [Chlamydomonas eustigma]|uniref:Uncharacterized protein n=1 Tax=Chlamydomonas eustigma TaxID=1157962 RepID=A0A250WV08_9CHLO|nr:hypothetical protein CEUSTIGMA_g2083.t1 [Chlamydomonas eustigma]|eukprot:GAX74635.1 hypothetical protein CEUSTIGMA_g2083.t1 [Chlamydomonas eustigma]
MNFLHRRYTASTAQNQSLKKWRNVKVPCTVDPKAVSEVSTAVEKDSGFTKDVSFKLLQSVMAAAVSSQMLFSDVAHAHLVMQNMPESSEQGSNLAHSYSTAVSRFSCTPLSADERTQAFDVGTYHHKIFSSSPKAQQFFDQGMMLAFNFNREESLKSFEAALKEDPEAPMIRWGIAYALGPDLNKAAVEPASDPMDYPSFSNEERQKGLKQLEVAEIIASRQLLRSDLTMEQKKLLEHDQAYILALLPVFKSENTWGEQYRAAQSKYADDLLSIASQYQEDQDATPLAGEALFDLQPWDAWDPLTKAPVGRVLEILDLLEGSLERSPGHPLALHLLIHSTESLPAGRGVNSAGRGEAAGDMLATSKRSFAHLTHMASHVYYRVGRWHDGVEINKVSVDIDKRDAARCLQPYLPMHNLQTLLYGAGMGGYPIDAEAYAQEFKRFPEIFGPGYMADGRERAMLPLVWSRFGEWDKVLSLTPEEMDYSNDGMMMPRGAIPYNQAVYHYTRTLALASKAMSSSVRDEALMKVQTELDALRMVVRDVPPDPRTKPGPGLGMWTSGFNMAGRQLLQVAEGRVSMLNGDLGGAEKHLKQALEIEKEELYAEPSYFYQPARPCLGAVLLSSGRAPEAAEVYKQDLELLPENAWSSVGLKQALSKEAVQETATPSLSSGADQLFSSCPAYMS